MKLNTTKKILLSIYTLLVLIVIVVIVIDINKLILNYKFKIIKTDIQTQIYPEKEFYPIQDTLSVDFEKINNDTIQLADDIRKKIETALKNYNWNNEFRTDELYKIYHETIFAQQFTSTSLDLQRLIVIVFTSYTGNFSHASSGRISLFEYQKQENNWQLTSQFPAFGNGNEYGLEPVWCKLVTIGNKNQCALIVQTTYSGNGGHDKETQSVYTEVDGQLESVFEFTNYEYYNDQPSDITYTEGNSQMRFINTGKSWYDIETKSENTLWNDKTPGNVKRYAFIGKEYVEQKKTCHHQ